MLELNLNQMEQYDNTPSRISGLGSASSEVKTNLNFVITKPINRPRKSRELGQLNLTVPLDLLSTSVIQDSKSEIITKVCTEISSPTKSLGTSSPDSSPSFRLARSIRLVELETKRPSIDNDLLAIMQDNADQPNEETTKISPPVKSIKIPENKKPNKIQLFLQNKWVTFLIMFFNIYALFGDDMRLLAFYKSADQVFGALTILTICIFLAEMILNFVSTPRYRWSFFFFLDLVSTFSLVFDIPVVNDSVFYPDPSKSSQTNLTNLGKTGQKALIGLRVFRLVRFFRVGKIYRELLRLKHQYELKSAARKQKQRIEELKQKEYKQEVLETFKKYGSRRRRVTPMAFAPVQSSYEGKVDLPSGFSNLRKRDSLSIIRQKGEQGLNGRRDSLSGLMQTRSGSSISSYKSSGSSFDGINVVSSNSTSSMGSPARNSISSVTSAPEPTTAARPQAISSDHPLKEMKVGGRLIDLTTKRLIFTVIILLILSPAFEQDYYTEDPNPGDFLTEVFAQANTANANAAGLKNIYDASINDLANRSNPLIYFKVPQFDTAWVGNTDPSTLRNCELSITSWSSADNGDDDILIIIDQRIFSQIDAGLRIAWTTFVCLVFLIASISFSRLVSTLLLRPLEAMIAKVSALAHNPLSWKEHMLEEDSQGSIETVKITNSIAKMSALVSLGLGQVGTEILLRNVQKIDEVDIFKQGSKRLGIFGYCGIRNFTELTMHLDQNVVSFVNTLASIIHGKTVKYQGSPCQMFREAFSVVWNFLESDQVQMKEGHLALKMTRRSINICNLAIIAFVKIYARILRDVKVKKYTSNLSTQENSRNLKASIGLGLHFGWAIEGVVGSEYKIDACYLSPHINVAYQLETATKIYGVPLLLSGRLHSKCSDGMKKLLRKLDRVLLKGSNEAIEIYTIDIDITKLPAKQTDHEESKAQKKGRKVLREDLIKRIASGKGRIETLLQSDNDLYEMTKESGEGSFMTIWNETVEAYLKGEWLRTKRLLGECEALRPNDEPCKALSNYLARYSFLSPLKWPGYRDLKEDLA